MIVSLESIGWEFCKSPMNLSSLSLSVSLLTTGLRACQLLYSPRGCDDMPPDNAHSSDVDQLLIIFTNEKFYFDETSGYVFSPFCNF